MYNNYIFNIRKKILEKNQFLSTNILNHDLYYNSDI